MNVDFDSKLDAFAKWARQQSPKLGDAIDGIIATSYISQLSEATPPVVATSAPAQTTADKISSFIDSVGKTYLSSVSAYYTAKGKVADLQLASKGSLATQVVNTASGAVAIPPTNTLLLIGGGLLAVVLLMRK